MNMRVVQSAPILRAVITWHPSRLARSVMLLAKRCWSCAVAVIWLTWLWLWNHVALASASNVHSTKAREQVVA